MGGQKFKVIFAGDIVAGAGEKEVKKKLARAFKVDIQKIEPLFSGRPKVVKKEASYEACQKTRGVFDSAGAVCVIVPQDTKLSSQDIRSTAPAVPTSPATPSPPTVDVDSPPQPSPSDNRRIALSTSTAPGVPRKATLLLLTAFLGCFGIHKFYLRKYVQGAFCLLFSWTLIPGFLAFFEFIRYACTSSATLQDRYKVGSPPLVIIMAVCAPVVFVALLTLAIIIATPIFFSRHPQFITETIFKYVNPANSPAIRDIPLAIGENHASGQIHGFGFVVDQAVIRNGVLHLKHGQEFFADQEFIVFLFSGGQSLAGQLFTIPDQALGQAAVPHIHLRWQDEAGQPQSEMAMEGYQLRLKFGEIDGSSVKGEIVLKIPELAGTYLSGTFTALIDE